MPLDAPSGMSQAIHLRGVEYTLLDCVGCTLPGRTLPDWIVA